MSELQLEAYDVLKQNLAKRKRSYCLSILMMK